MEHLKIELASIGLLWKISRDEKSIDEGNLRRFFLCYWLYIEFGFILTKDIMRWSHLSYDSCILITSELVRLGVLEEAQAGAWKGYGDRKAWIVTRKGKLLYTRCMNRIKKQLQSVKLDYIHTDNV